MSTSVLSDVAFLRCVSPDCGAKYGVDEIRVACGACGGLLDVAYDWDRAAPPDSFNFFEKKWSHRNDPLAFSGVWRFHELLPFAPAEGLVTIGEGQTPLIASRGVARYVGGKPGRVLLQYEGQNPSGSFKDNGMAAAFTHARAVGAQRAACASTGNTSASLALYCAATGLMKGIIFIGSGKISFGKLSQALDYGALTLQIAGDFDDAMRRVQEVAAELRLYLVNSVNPFRLEGQKTIMFRVLESLGWRIPDWIVVPGGNLGNTSAFGKAFVELKEIGLIDRIPRIAVINASGASTLYELYEKRGLRWNGGHPDRSIVDSYYQELTESHRRASTIASAIEINRPVNLVKCLRSLEACDGVVREVSDEEILDAKAQIGAGGLGCEPASAASVAGLKRLIAEKVIEPDAQVVCILTGHLLKDPDATVAYHTGRGQKGGEQKSGAFANRPVEVANDLAQIVDVLSRGGH